MNSQLNAHLATTRAAEVDRSARSARPERTPRLNAEEGRRARAPRTLRLGQAPRRRAALQGS